MPPAILEKYLRVAAQFPDPDSAPPEGILGYGLDLEPDTLLCAYSKGIFPWFNPGDPILWWSPDPRCVLFPHEFRLPRRSGRYLKNHPFDLTWNECFADVIRQCASPRKEERSTWITADMARAYRKLHKLGYAHSVEAWANGRLVGGVYGIALGRAFFGESMFHRQPEASRAALAGLVALLRQKDFIIIDCQQTSPHMLRMGACEIPRHEFLLRLDEALSFNDNPLNFGGLVSPWRPWTERYVYRGDEWEEMG